MAKIIGIDLGTSNSAASVVMGGKPTIIPAAEGTTVGGEGVSVGCCIFQNRRSADRRTCEEADRDKPGFHRNRRQEKDGV